MKRLLAVATVAGTISLMGAGPALACGGLVNPNGTVTLVKTTTLAGYRYGVEHYITVFKFDGGGAKFGSIVSIPLNLSCSFMDYFMYPDRIWDFFKIRVACGILTMLVWFWFTRPSGRCHRRIFGVTWFMGPLLMVLWMIYSVNDPLSPYYAGLNIILLAMGLISPWTYKQNLVITVFVLMMYVVVAFAMTTAQPNFTVLYPCDGNQAAALVRAMADVEGISYLRTTRADTTVIYDAGEQFPVGGSRTLREGDDVTIVAAGITVHEALAAADELAEEGVAARVIDCYSVKPVDAGTLRSAAEATGCRGSRRRASRAPRRWRGTRRARRGPGPTRSLAGSARRRGTRRTSTTSSRWSASRRPRQATRSRRS